MNVISYIKLYNRLRKDGLSPWEAVVSIDEVRKMDAELLDFVQEWIETGVSVDLTIAGISFARLTKAESEGGEGMKPIRAFLMLDWLKKDSAEALFFLSKRRFHAPLEALTANEAQTVKEQLEQLQSRKPEYTQPIVNDCDDICQFGEDIVIPSTEDSDTSDN